MDYRIVKQTINKGSQHEQTYWALMEYRENVNAPWVCIADDKNRKRLERYKAKLESGVL